MTHVLEFPPAVEQALETNARRRGVSSDEYLRAVVAREVELDEIGDLYGDSIESGGEMTASTRFQDDLHEYSPDELAAMEAGEFARPL